MSVNVDTKILEIETKRLANDQELRAELNKFMATLMRWKRTSGYNEKRSNALRDASSTLAKLLLDEMVDEENIPLWTPAECVMVLAGTIAVVAYGSIFPEKQRSLLGTLKREANIDAEYAKRQQANAPKKDV